MKKSHLALQLLRYAHGFVTDKELEIIATQDRFCPLIVRCGCGRFQVSAQDCKHFVDIITREKSDYVRDVSVAPNYKTPASNYPDEYETVERIKVTSVSRNILSFF